MSSPSSKFIKTLFIPNLDKTITPTYIIQIFQKKQIAILRPEQITIKRCRAKLWKKSGVCSEALIEVEHWLDTEAAYQFIQSLRQTITPTKLIHHNSNDAWFVKEYNRPSQTPSLHDTLPKDNADIEDYLKEVCTLVNTFAHYEDSWLSDEELFKEYEREMFALSLSLLQPHIEE